MEKIIEHAAVAQEGGGVEAAGIQPLQRRGMATSGQGEITAVLNKTIYGPQNRWTQALIRRRQRTVKIVGKENALKTHESLICFSLL